MRQNINNDYDNVADEYARHFCDELDAKPFDRMMLNWMAERVGSSGVICDMGCGPGHIARYLTTRGANVCGLDLSHEMIRQARVRNPGINFQQGDMLSLSDIADNSYGGIAAFYSIIHIPRQHVKAALCELKRVLQPKGILLLAFHIGSEVKHLDELLGKRVSLDFVFFETSEMKTNLVDAGFELNEVIERDPYPEIEYQSRRGYIFATKP